MAYLMLGLLGAATAYVALDAMWRRYAYGQLVIHAFTQHPIANTRPPTGIEGAGLYVAEESP